MFSSAATSLTYIFYDEISMFSNINDSYGSFGLRVEVIFSYESSSIISSCIFSFCSSSYYLILPASIPSYLSVSDFSARSYFNNFISFCLAHKSCLYSSRTVSIISFNFKTSSFIFSFFYLLSSISEEFNLRILPTVVE